MARFDLELTPIREGSQWVAFGVNYRIELDSVEAGDVLLCLPQMVTSIPGMTLSTADLTVTDDVGLLALTEGEPRADTVGVTRTWSAQRATVGAVNVAYTAPARVIDERTPIGPLFDLRAEQLGLVGAGVWFLALPPTESIIDRTAGEVFEITLRWSAPADVVTISGHGMGDVSWSAPLQSVLFLYYAAGTPHSAPRLDPAFGLHVFSHAPFDSVPIAEYLEALYRDMSAFFGTQDSNYHVLVRRNLSSGTGGTALPGAFAFGYSAVDEPDVDAMRSLLAHEMAHNWPRLDTDASMLSWYSEGAAEYYSFVLALRGGHLSAQAFVDTLTDRFQGYDANPLHHMTNDEAYAAYWLDPRAQRVPYGRGLRYFIATNAQIIAASGGEASLDDPIKRVVAAQAMGETVDHNEWVDLVAEHLGDAAREQYDAMMAGTEIAVADHIFEGVARPMADTIEEIDVGFDMASFHAEPRVVSGVVAGSAADRAGLRDGDELVSKAVSYTAIRGNGEVELVVLREGVATPISYTPRGKSVPTIRWQLVEETP